MDILFDHALSGGHGLLLALCLLIALAFEFVNGFHDTANAVATVIYTHSLRPGVAVALSGVCNFAGVFLGGIAVALGIIKLLPLELLVQSGTGAGLAMVLALLLSAILWNLGTWWLGLPASSSHTLIGAILGVGVANSLRPGHHFGDGVHWGKAGEIGLSLLASPLIGFALSALCLLAIKRFSRSEALLQAPRKNAPPPAPVRALLLATCSGVSFAHGSNDGQKGVGLVMVILMGLMPAGYAVNLHASARQVTSTVQAAERIERTLAAHAPTSATTAQREALAGANAQLDRVRDTLTHHGTVAEIPRDERFALRQAILLADARVERLASDGTVTLDAAQRAQLANDRKQLRGLTDYAPRWVLVAIALALGIGTTFGWKRIVVTVGEKIGKAHLTYAQGASAELVAASTIGLSALLGLPVSTTHVLSSGIAGTMVAHRSGLQRATVRNIALAWVFTLPATMLLSGLLFTLLRAILA